METPQRPLLFARPATTPPITPAPIQLVPSESKTRQHPASILTPPTSPQKTCSPAHAFHGEPSASAASISPPDLPPSISRSNLTKNGDARYGSGRDHVPLPDIVVPACPFEIEMVKDDHGRDVVFGTGAWSTVYKATATARHQTQSVPASWTPPQSPTLVAPAFVAVKRPARRDGAPILTNEARVLSYLHTVPDGDKYIVPFYGLMADATLVLEAIPTSLDQHIRQCAAQAARNFSTATMREPVLGSTAKWLVLAHQLVSALTWMHDVAEVVHGDIKPANILLSHTQGAGDDATFTPLFADFSSSQLLTADEMAPNTLSAVTREYTAPELLSAAVLRDPCSTATPASDVFSLAVTLLVAATGQLLVYGGNVFQRQAMATQGWMVLPNARNGEQGSRIPHLGVVDRVLERAVLKAGMGRVNAQTWLGIIEQAGLGEPSKP